MVKRKYSGRRGEIRRAEEEENKLRNIKTKLRLFSGMAAAVAVACMTRENAGNFKSWYETHEPLPYLVAFRHEWMNDSHFVFTMNSDLSNVFAITIGRRRRFRHCF